MTNFIRFLTKALAWRAGAVVFTTSSIWFTIWFYNWSEKNLGSSYATAFGWVSALTGVGLFVACCVWAAMRSNES